MHLPSLKLIRPIVKEEMHLQANTLFDLGVKVRGGGGGGTLIFSHIRRLGLFWGFKILNFNIFWGFQKN